MAINSTKIFCQYKDEYRMSEEEGYQFGSIATYINTIVLVALGARSSNILRIFITKAFILGFIGGIGGYVIGTLLGIILGPLIAGIPVLPVPYLIIWSLIISTSISTIASYFPARYATRIDPRLALQET